MAGRKRVPMEKRIVEGTVRASHKKRAEGTPLVAVYKIESCPGLSARAQKYWPIVRKVLQSLPVTAESDMIAVQRLAECYAEVLYWQEVLEKEGRTYTSNTKEGIIMRAHPGVGALSDADKRLRAYMTDFGLTPASRTRVKGDNNAEIPHDPLQEFVS